MLQLPDESQVVASTGAFKNIFPASKGRSGWQGKLNWALERAVANNKGLSGAHGLSIKDTHLLSMRRHHAVVSLSVLF